MNEFNWDGYFWSLESRYRKLLFDSTKAALDNAGYRGMALVLIFSERSAYLKAYQEKPFLKDIVNAFEGEFLFNKKKAVSLTLKDTVDIRNRIESELKNAHYDKVDPNVIPIDYIINVGNQKIGYLPDSLEEALDKAKSEKYVVKLLLRYYVTKCFVKAFEPLFKSPSLKSISESTVQKNPEMLNEEVESLGVKHFPELFGYNLRVNKEAVSDTSEQESTTTKELTNAQQVLAIMLINKFLKLSKSQEKKSLQDFIFALTNKNYREIGDKMKAITDNEFEPNVSPKQGIKDYNAIKPLMERLEQKAIVEFIDKKLKELNSKNY